MLKHHMENKSSDNTIELFVLQLVCHIFSTIVAFNADIFWMKLIVVPKPYQKYKTENYFLILCKKIYML